jgi:hypothetical protein
VSLIRIVDCGFSMMADSFIMSVDVIHPEDSDKNTNHRVVAPRRKVSNKEDLQRFVEDAITQKQSAIDWTGYSWKSSIDE